MPLSAAAVTAATLSASAQCFTVARAVQAHCSRYGFGEATAMAILEASTDIIASLESLRTKALANPSHKLSTDGLASALDVVFAGSVTVFAALEALVTGHVRELREAEARLKSMAQPYLEIWRSEVMEQGIKGLHERKKARDAQVGEAMDLYLQYARAVKFGLSILVPTIASSTADVSAMLAKYRGLFNSISQQAVQLKQHHPSLNAPATLLNLTPTEIAAVCNPATLDENMLTAPEERNYKLTMEFALPILQQLHGVALAHLDERDKLERTCRNLWTDKEKLVKDSRLLTQELVRLKADQRELRENVEKLEARLRRAEEPEEVSVVSPAAPAGSPPAERLPAQKLPSESPLASPQPESPAVRSPPPKTRGKKLQNPEDAPDFPDNSAVFELEGTPIVHIAELGGQHSWPFESKFAKRWQTERRKSF